MLTFSRSHIAAPGLGRGLNLLLGLLLTAGAGAKLLMTKEQALETAFPEADRIERKALYFSEAEAERVAELARAKMDSRLFTVYIGYRDGETSGYAFIDTRTIRTKPATFLVVLSPDGRIRQSRILAWQEPPEYRASDRWLAQFLDQGLGSRMALGRSIQGMSGATYTSRTLTNGIRRVLAIYRVKLAGAD